MNHSLQLWVREVVVNQARSKQSDHVAHSIARCLTNGHAFIIPSRFVREWNTLESLRAFIVRNISAARHLRFVNVAYTLCALYAARKVLQITRRRLKTTALRGPPNPSFLFDVTKALISSPNSAEVYEKWAGEYGGAFEISSLLGRKSIVLSDSKAIAHVWGGEPWSYSDTWREGCLGEPLGQGQCDYFDKRGSSKRRASTSAFSSAAIRDLASVFYDSAYKASGTWDSLIASNGVIDVQSWMNHISLDTIGIVGYSHEFGSLDGKKNAVIEVIEFFNNINVRDSRAQLLGELALAFPIFNLPTPYAECTKRLNDAMGEISNVLLAKLSKEKEAGTLGESEEKSILGLPIKAEAQDNRFHLTPEEVMAQAKILIVAGYETTSISMTWALIELAKNPHIQTRLRTELLEFGADPTYDQLPNNLPYLDAVVHEILRVHPPIEGFTRMAAMDDAIPLSKPVLTRSGQPVDHISVAKGTVFVVSASAMNCSASLWGPDAKEFRPERWIVEGGIPDAAQEIQGHRHLLTFFDGPRICLGKGFAITEFKIVLAVLVKNFMFELRDGPETVIEMAPGVLPRPKVAGEQGAAVPLRVKRFE